MALVMDPHGIVTAAVAVFAFGYVNDLVHQAIYAVAVLIRIIPHSYRKKTDIHSNIRRLRHLR